MSNDIFGGFMAVAQSISDKTTPMDTEDVEKLPGPGEEREESNQQSRRNAEENLDHIPLKDTEEEIEEEEIAEEEEVEEGATVEEEEEEPDLHTKEKSTEEPSDLGEAEPDIAAYVQEKMFEKFGFEIGEEKFESIEDVVDFVQAVVEENSKPQYPNEELAKMDEYVRNGGDIRRYYESTLGGVDPSNVDIDSYNDQKKVIAEHLKTKGYNDVKITRAIERYEEAGVLKEEAEDALEMLDEHKQEISEKLLEEQKKQKELILEEQQKYVGSVKDEIEALSDIRGIPLTTHEKKELFEYIFKPTQTGKTRYQEDYIKSQKNMIESAFFTMKGDAFVKKVQKKATSEAASRLRKKLANKGARGRNQTGQGGNTVSDIWGVASSQLRSPF